MNSEEELRIFYHWENKVSLGIDLEPPDVGYNNSQIDESWERTDKINEQLKQIEKDIEEFNPKRRL